MAATALSGSSRPVVLVGLMGAGKTTLGRRLGAVDVDDVLTERLVRPPGEVFAAEGEAAFRAAEEEVVLELLKGPDPPRALALGGGALGSERVREALRTCEVVWLDVSAGTAWARVERSSRPLARDFGAFARLHAERERAYAAAASLVILEGEDAEAALAWGAARPPGTALLWGRHPVVLGAVGGWWPLAGRRFTVTDENVARVAPAPEPCLVLPPGEEQKTLRSAERVWRWLAAEGATRADHVAAVGGGVVGDLAGFCASAYQRGIPVVQVPTTLVAQVDSALGGKTGVDLPEAKNYVGAYHQPAAVLADPAVLGTLPAAERAAGFAEVVKTALIAGGWLWERVRGGAVDDAEVIRGCALTKLRVVGEDERDGGRRQVLNLGHTVAHALETVTGYARYRHGEAVGLGLLAALRLSGQEALRDEVAGLLAGQGLPTRLDGVAAEEVVAATAKDKKRTGEGDVPFVLVQAPGEVTPGHRLPAGAVRAAVEDLAS